MIEEEFCPEPAAYFLNKLCSNINKIKDILNKYQYNNDSECKYLNLYQWFCKHVYICKSLNLHKITGARILDIGSGPCLFSFLLKQLGHDVLGLDLADRAEFYKEMSNALSISVMDYTIMCQQPLPNIGMFDYIVILMASFYFKPEFCAEDWDFFLTDLESHVNNDGIILIELNKIASGIFYNLDVYNIFILHRYVFCGRFCVRFPSHADYKELNMIFIQLSRAGFRSNFNGISYLNFIWGRDQLSPSISNHLATLRKEFPNAIDILAHDGLLDALYGKRKQSLKKFKNVLQLRPTTPGYCIALCQLLLLNGLNDEALRIMEKAASVTGNTILCEFRDMLYIHFLKGNRDSSAYLKKRILLLQSNEFRSMVSEYKELQQQKDPAAWYILHGAMALSKSQVFTPIIYWGLHHDVFLSGMDPLIHYLSFGKAQGFGY